MKEKQGNKPNSYGKLDEADADFIWESAESAVFLSEFL